MAEYILKTELPITTCRVCPCAEHTPFGTVCQIKRGSEKRYGTCPLVEVKEGVWLSCEDGVYECSVCHEPYILDDTPTAHNYHYCPNCGAKMEVDYE